ncbi:hypothetical protein ACFP81_10335 [Deinococcus lacus]|uniref:LPS-assembly protein LptD n=1 Tax=Deinococcus lacus TaxID=392561 RepID=A0ABW1YGK0_9DEIO
MRALGNWKRWGLGLVLGLTLGLGAAEARTVRITEAGALELRRVTVEGAEQELVILTAAAGGRVELRVDDDVVRAQRIEFNRTARTLTLIGEASYYTAKDGQTLGGTDLVVDLKTESLTGEDVLVSDSELLIQGQEIERVPGQLQAMGSYFTPCAKCGRTPNDYAFRAEHLIVYPGDRLVAYRAQFLVADQPVLYLPVLVIPLGERSRQPRLALSQDERDGFTAEADLPFSVGDHTLGTTLLRYYENRPAQFGVGVDMRSYAPLPFIDQADLYVLALPRPFKGSEPVEGRDLDLDFGVKGRLGLEYALRDLTYDLRLTQRDIGRSDTDPLRGVATLNLTAQAEYPLFTAALNVSERFGPEPTTGLGSVYRREVVLDPKPYQSGDFSADFRMSAGRYTGRSNPASPSASRQGPNITADRLEEQHDIAYRRDLWEGASFGVRNRFTGRYYSTGARTVDLNIDASLTQKFGPEDRNSVTARAEYFRYEGTSPFAFDALSGRRLSAPISVALSTVPVKDMTFGVTHRYDLYLEPQDQSATDFNLRVNRAPVNLNAAAKYDFYTGDWEDLTLSVTLGDSRALDRAAQARAQAQRERDAATSQETLARAAVSTEPAVPAGQSPLGSAAGRPPAPANPSAEPPLVWPWPHLSFSANGGFGVREGVRPFTFRTTVTADQRANNFSVFLTHDFATSRLRTIGLEANAVSTVDAVVNPVVFTANEQYDVPSERLSGAASATWRGEYAFSTRHSFLLKRPAGATSDGELSFSVGTKGSGRANNWQLTYGGPYDLSRQGWTAPNLTGALTLTEPGQRLSASATLNLPGLDQRRAELVRANLDGEWQPHDRFSVSGRASYSRVRRGTYPLDIPTDTLTFAPLRVAVGLGSAERPDAYLTGSLEQSFTWVDGVAQNPQPIAPVIGLTIDRCCWAARAEADVKNGRYRLSVGLPGAGFNPLLDYGKDGLDVPLLPKF